MTLRIALRGALCTAPEVEPPCILGSPPPHTAITPLTLNFGSPHWDPHPHPVPLSSLMSPPPALPSPHPYDLQPRPSSDPCPPLCPPPSDHPLGSTQLALSPGWQGYIPPMWLSPPGVASSPYLSPGPPSPSLSCVHVSLPAVSHTCVPLPSPCTPIQSSSLFLRW